ncbi:MAG: hypothetical protein ACREOH_04765, partial [Candidatus Entotheonellia bacterium]
HTLNRRVGPTGLPLAVSLRLWTAAAVAAAAALAGKLALGPRHPILVAALLLVPYGLIYMAITYRWGLPEAHAVIERFLPMAGRRPH